MKLSIIIPVYNAQRTIRKCADSVIKSSWNEYEIILVDDGSTDQSQTICREYLVMPNVKLIAKENGGVSSARNVGLDVAVGEYVLFLDSDDWLEKGALDILLEQMKSKKDLYVFGIKYIKNGTEVGRCASIDCTGKNKNEIMFELFMCNQFGYACAKMIRRHVIDMQKVRFDESMKIREDQNFMMRIWDSIKSVLYIQLPLYCYNQTSGSAMQKYYRKMIESFKWYVTDLQDNLKRIEGFMEGEGITEAHRGQYRIFYVHQVLHNALNVVLRSSDSYEPFYFLAQSELASIYILSPIQKKGKFSIYEWVVKRVLRHPHWFSFRVLSAIYRRMRA